LTKSNLFARLERVKKLTDQLARLLTRQRSSRASSARPARRARRVKSGAPR